MTAQSEVLNAEKLRTRIALKYNERRGILLSREELAALYGLLEKMDRLAATYVDVCSYSLVWVNRMKELESLRAKIGLERIKVHQAEQRAEAAERVQGELALEIEQAHKMLDMFFAEKAPESTCAKCRDHSVGYRAARALEVGDSVQGELLAAQQSRINLFELHQKMTAHLFPAYSSTDERFLGLALAGEVGELCNIVKKRWRDGADLTEEIRDEIADIRVYLELMAKCFDIEGPKLDQRVQAKLEKVVQRNAERAIANAQKEKDATER